MHELDKLPCSKGIVHSDLSKSNLIVFENKIIPIDFCLSGYSYFYMDLGSLFSHFDKNEQRTAIKKGYLSLMNIEFNNRYTEAFFIYQIILFISTHLNSISNTDWFPEALKRWCNNYFNPFATNKPFIVG
jgi:thiamine kinase-like enzyme